MTQTQTGPVHDLGPPFAWVLLDLTASRSTGVLLVTRAQGHAEVHFRAGRVTRVQGEDLEALVKLILRKGLATPGQIEEVWAEVEHLDVTLSQAVERVGLMSRKELTELRAERTSAALEELVCAGARVKEFEKRPADAGPVVEVVGPVLRGLLRSDAPNTWLTQSRHLTAPLTRTEKFWKLRQQVTTFIDDEAIPASQRSLADVSDTLNDEQRSTLAALAIAGLLEAEVADVETPEELERHAAELDATEEACRLLIRASQLYEEREDLSNARRAALSALRRRPTLTAPLTQVERLCINANEVATLELVYELVNGAMPGPFGRRALLYRAGRVFEQDVGDLDRSREYYRRSVSQMPEESAALEGLERTSRAIDDMRPVIDAFVTVGLSSDNWNSREDWLQRAAELAIEAGSQDLAQEILQHLEPQSEDEVEPIEAKAPSEIEAEADPETALIGLPDDAESAPFAPPSDEFAFLPGEDIDAAFAAEQEREEAPPERSSLDDLVPSDPAAVQLDNQRSKPKDLSAMTEEDMSREVSSALDAAFRAELDSILEAPATSDAYEAEPEPRQEEPARKGPSEVDISKRPSSTPIYEGPRQSPSSVPPMPRPTPPPEAIAPFDPVEVESVSRLQDDEVEEPLTIMASPDGGVRLRQLCTSFLESPPDLQRLHNLKKAAKKTGDDLAGAGVDSIMALFDARSPSLPLGSDATLARFSTELIRQAAMLPKLPELQVLVKLWRAAPQLIAKELSELGVNRALPQSKDTPTPASLAFAKASRLVESELDRVLYLPAGSMVKLVLTRPPSVLIGPSGQEDSPELRFRVTRAVAMGHIELLLPCALHPEELHKVLMALQAAFGESPPPGSLSFDAASLAQDLWSAVPASVQKSLRHYLGLGPLPEAEDIHNVAKRSANLISLLVTGDAATAVRIAAAEDPFLAGTDPTTEEGFLRAVNRSAHVQAIVRTALSPRYWEFRHSG